MTDSPANPHEHRLVVLAPRGRDGDVVLLVLRTAGFTAKASQSLREFLALLQEGASVGIVTEEALCGDELAPLTAWLASQPPWSDLPLLILATRQPGRRPAQAMALLEALGNVVLLERPLNAETLTSAARAAQRSRKRQYETRRHLEEQQRIHRENARLYEVESRALREVAESRNALLAAERTAREEAELGNRTKDEFLATLSHELRTPLSAILGWVYVLKARAPSAAELAKGVDVIERNARAQAQLIDELLDMSRIIASNIRLDLQRLAPLAVIEAALASIQPSADAKSIRIERAIDPAVGPVRADPQRLLQIVWNLLSNSVKFTPVGGSIKVRACEALGHMVLSVQDSGEGIAAEFLPFVFDRFRQADGSTARRHGGLGLGLAVVRNLVDLHKGTVECSSEGPGRGALLTVRIPLADTRSIEASVPAPVVEQRAPAQRVGESIRLDRIRIVVVDDDRDSREMIARVFSDLGAEVVTAESAKQAGDAVARGPVDLLVSDIGMPEVDGYELVRCLRRLGHRFPALALTAFAREEDRHKALATGFSAHLSKPFEAPDLVALAAELTADRRLGNAEKLRQRYDKEGSNEQR